MTDIKTLNNFFDELKTKGARLKNQWQVFVNTPYPEVNRSLENLTIYAEGVNLPGRAQEETEMKYMGYPFWIPTHATMTQEITLTIRSDALMEIRNAMLKWQSYISDPNIEGGSNMQGDKRIPANSFIRIRLLNSKFDEVTNTYNLVGAYPQKIGDMDLSNTDTGIATFTSSFRFQYWKLEENNTDKFTDLV